MTAKKHRTKLGRTEAERQADNLKALERFHQLYPPAVIRDLRDNLLKHSARKLEEASFADDANLIGNEAFAFQWYLEV